MSFSVFPYKALLKLRNTKIDDSKKADLEQQLQEWNNVVLLQDEILALSKNAFESTKKRKLIAAALQNYIEYYTTKKRQPASKILVITIAEETRTKKPYSWVVQSLAIRSLSNMEVESFMDKIGKTIEDYGGNFTSRITDGEQNSLRSMGKQRPRSIMKVKKNKHC